MNTPDTFANDYHALCVEAARRFPSVKLENGSVYVPFGQRFAWCEQFVKIDMDPA